MTVFPDKNIGITETERRLSSICSKTFLKLWSWTSLYSDEGITKNKIGKEICDLLVYFNNTVVLFSDKNVIYSEDKNKNAPQEDGTSVAWKRWKRRAVESSVKQLEGAESWIRNHFDRIFFTDKCLPSERFPFINGDNINNIKIYRVAIANGCPNPLYLGNGVGDGIITGCKDRHGNYIHVFDGATIETLTQELSTVNEFVGYLDEKERIEREGFFNQYDKLNELDLLATYLLSPTTDRDAGFYYNDDNFIVECFNELVNSTDYLVGKNEDQISIIFDDLIEHISAQLLKGSVICTGFSKFEANQNVLEILCNFNRLYRRLLSKNVIDKFKQTSGRAISSRSTVLGEDSNAPIFAVVIFPKAACKGVSRAGYEYERRLIGQAYATHYQHEFGLDRNIVVVVFDNISEIAKAWDSNYKDFIARVYKKDFALVFRGMNSVTQQDIDLFFIIQNKWGILKSSPISIFSGRAYQYHN